LKSVPLGGYKGRLFNADKGGNNGVGATYATPQRQDGRIVRGSL
jgi:hypothetical protein